MNNPLVSVGIPTFHRPYLLSKSLRTVLNQSYRNLEIIISSNAIDKDTKEVVTSVHDDRIKFFEQKQNLGSVANFNFLLEISRGDYFMWLADDDLISTNFISTAVSRMEVNHYIGACHGKVFYKNGYKIRFKELIIKLNQVSSQERVIHYCQNVTSNGVFYSLYRKSTISDIRMREELASDWSFFAEVVNRSFVKYEPSIFILRDFRGGYPTEHFYNLAKSFRHYLFPNIVARLPHIWIAKEVPSNLSNTFKSHLICFQLLKLKVFIVLLQRGISQDIISIGKVYFLKVAYIIKFLFMSLINFLKQILSHKFKL